MLAQPRFRLPANGTPGRKILAALLAGRCTFWVATERAKLEFETEDDETVLRVALDALIDSGCASTDGRKYAINARAKAMLESAATAPAKAARRAA